MTRQRMPRARRWIRLALALAGVLAGARALGGRATRASIAPRAREGRRARKGAAGGEFIASMAPRDSDGRGMISTARRERVELDGAVVRAGFAVASDDACERACAKTRGCNVWVRFRGAEGACWLKRAEAPTRARVMSSGDACAWNSGVMEKDVGVSAGEVLASAVGARTRDAGAVELVVDGFGTARLTLEPTWHEASAAFLRALAAIPSSCADTCEIYRVEPGFLVQGTLRSFDVASNAETRDGPRLMERGDVGWAGEGPGPDFFVYLGRRPAAHFGVKHTVFARVADERSLAVLERVVRAPSSAPGGTNAMRFIDRRPRLTVRPASATA